MKTSDGTTNECSVWFWELEKSMKKLRISKEEYVLHAINASSDKARTTICLLDDEFESDYCQIKQAMISIFDTKQGKTFKENSIEHSNTVTRRQSQTFTFISSKKLQNYLRKAYGMKTN